MQDDKQEIMVKRKTTEKNAGKRGDPVTADLWVSEGKVGYRDALARKIRKNRIEQWTNI